MKKIYVTPKLSCGKFDGVQLLANSISKDTESSVDPGSANVLGRENSFWDEKE